MIKIIRRRKEEKRNTLWFFWKRPDSLPRITASTVANGILEKIN